jgi:BR serine/threonine kinase
MSDPPEPAREKVVGPYVFLRTLGQGTTGRVVLARHNTTGEHFAIKVVNKTLFQQQPNLERKIKREIGLMQVVRHPNILRLFDVLESDGHMFIVLEYAERGELFDFLVARETLPVELAVEVFRELVLTVEYLHFHGICHRDLKPENILLDSCERIKLADFGFARWSRSSVSTTSCGSPHYAAPEVIRGLLYDGRRADIWSLGVILFALICGYLPFDDPSIRVTLRKVKKGEFTFPPGVPADIADLIRKIVTVDPDRRLTIPEIKAHPCFLRGADVSYIFPRPIPHPPFTMPIEVSSLTAEMRAVLAAVGYSDEELGAELAGSGTSMAKIFVVLLRDSLDLEKLPWDLSENFFSEAWRPVDYVLSGAMMSGSPEFADGRGRLESSASMGSLSSTVTRPDWYIDAAPVSVVLEEHEVTLEDCEIWNLMAIAQDAARDCGVQFFHPDHFTLYIRSRDATFYGSVKARFVTPDSVSMRFALHKGELAQFSDFKDRLVQILQD